MSTTKEYINPFQATGPFHTPGFLVFSRGIEKDITSVIRQKWRIPKRVLQQNRARQIFRKTNISYPLIRTTKFSEKRFSQTSSSTDMKIKKM